MKEFPNLLSPIKIGSFTYKNRIEAAPTIFATMVLVPQISDRVIRMVEDRAKGGCASVVNGEIPVNFDDSLRPIIVGPGKLLQITVDCLAAPSRQEPKSFLCTRNSCRLNLKVPV